jgi:hypothetical protein
MCEVLTTVCRCLLIPNNYVMWLEDYVHESFAVNGCLWMGTAYNQ